MELFSIRIQRTFQLVSTLYVKKWSEITNEVERRLKYLLDKLKIERATLSKSQSLNEVMNEVSNNTAAMVS